jgi:Family of unknown function (DUF6152)
MQSKPSKLIQFIAWGCRVRRKLLLTLVLGVVLLVESNAISAHHGVASYDNGKWLTLKGTIVGFEWVNPHCLVHLDVKDADGNVQHWIMETPPPSAMFHGAGWSKGIMKPGDQAVVDVHPAKNGAPVGALANIVVNGKTLPFSR